MVVDRSHIKKARQFYSKLCHALESTLPRFPTVGSTQRHFAQDSREGVQGSREIVKELKRILGKSKRWHYTVPRGKWHTYIYTQVYF